jgi:DNA repair protein RadC
MYTIPHISLRIVREHVDREFHNLETHQIRTPQDAYTITAPLLEGADREYLVCLLLDTKNFVTGVHTVAIGGQNFAAIRMPTCFVHH